MSEEKKKTHLRFLHCSDIHLDTPFVGLTAEKSEERRRALRTSFLRMMQYVRDSKINVVLMSGDIFDTEYATNTTAEVLIREFKNCPDTVFIISPGQHDYYNGNPIYSSGRLPDNCFVFSSDKLSRFDFEEYNVTVYGWAFMDASLRENPLFERQVDDASRVNIVCAYVAECHLLIFNRKLAIEIGYGYKIYTAKPGFVKARTFKRAAIGIFRA